MAGMADQEGQGVIARARLCRTAHCDLPRILAPANQARREAFEEVLLELGRVYQNAPGNGSGIGWRAALHRLRRSIVAALAREAQ